MRALAEFGRQRLQRLAAGARQRDDGALAVQRARDRAAEAARGAGHQRASFPSDRTCIVSPEPIAGLETPRHRPASPTLTALRALGDALDEAGQHLAGADLDEPRHALRPP